MKKADSLSAVFLTNNRINLFVLDQLSEEQLSVAQSSRSRTIADQFAHLHQVRISWLEIAKPALAKKLSKIEKGKVGHKELKAALTQSAEAIAELLDESQESGTVKGYKKGVYSFFAYLIAHESHHRGQILLHLKNAGLPLDKVKGFEIWDWAKM